MERKLRGIVPEGNTPQHVNQYILQLNPKNGQYCTNLVMVAKENGYDFEVLLAVMLTRTKNFAEFNVDTDLFGVGIGGTAEEQILAACVNELSKFNIVDELGFSREELETYDMVYEEVRKMMRLKRVSDKAVPLPRKPEPIVIKPRPPIVVQSDKTAPEPTKTPAEKFSLLRLIPWWLWLIPILLFLALVAAVVLIPGVGPMLLSQVVPTLLNLIFKR